MLKRAARTNLHNVGSRVDEEARCHAVPLANLVPVNLNEPKPSPTATSTPPPPSPLPHMLPHFVNMPTLAHLHTPRGEWGARVGGAREGREGGGREATRIVHRG
jgi:hypothetical protein